MAPSHISVAEILTPDALEFVGKLVHRFGERRMMLLQARRERQKSIDAGILPDFQYPGKLLAYNCSPSFNWKRKMDEKTIAAFQDELGDMGYKFQFVTLAGFHALNHSMFELARQYKERGMAAYSELQQAEFISEQYGYTATRHQREVGTGYFDDVAVTVSGGTSSTTALTGSTEEEQFWE
jgi:isocitrate lyase